MLFGNHLLSGLVLAESYLLWKGYPRHLPDAIDIRLMSAALPHAGSIVIGSIFPDIDLPLEIKHRTLTHWPVLYMALLLTGLATSHDSIVLFSFAALIHIYIDSWTRAGVPLWSPFGKTYGMRKLITGGPAEILVMCGLIFCGVCVWMFACN